MTFESCQSQGGCARSGDGCGRIVARAPGHIRSRLQAVQRDAVIARAGVALPLMRLACWGKRSRPLGCQETVAFWLLGGCCGRYSCPPMCVVVSRLGPWLSRSLCGPASGPHPAHEQEYLHPHVWGCALQVAPHPSASRQFVIMYDTFAQLMKYIDVDAY